MTRMLPDTLVHAARATFLVLAAALAAGSACAAPTAEVIHWWTSAGEDAAVGELARAYRAAGGVWIDTAIAGPEQARAVAINRIAGGKPPTAAQFNLSLQFHDLVEQGLLNDVDEAARLGNWDQVLPQLVREQVRIGGHYYAAPVGIHMPAWFWFSAAALRKAGVTQDPRDEAEFFAVLDRFKAAGLVPLAHGGQAWQEMIVFTALLANFGGADLYRQVLVERDPRAIASPRFAHVLAAYKRLAGYADAAAPGRNWNDATAMVISGKAGVQIMGDWVKGEFTLAHQVPGRDYRCLPGLGPHAPYLIQGDVFVFPKPADTERLAAQRLLASVVMAPQTQLAFAARKGSIPARVDADATKLDTCAQAAMAMVRDPARQIGSPEFYLSPDENGALTDILTAYWNDRGNRVGVEKVQRDFAAALHR